MATEIALRLLLVALALALAAIRYDMWIAAQERRGRHDGYVSLYVAGGVLLVLGGATVAVWPLGDVARLTMLIVAGLFVAAGLPMIIGSINRHLDGREKAQDALRRLLDKED